MLRLPAYIPGLYYVQAAVYIHFDGAPKPCSSGGSTGYPPESRKDAEIADAWKALYKAYWPYRIMRDNFTGTEQGYYAYHHVIASKGQFLIEGGEMSCLKAADGRKHHLKSGKPPYWRTS